MSAPHAPSRLAIAGTAVAVLVVSTVVTLALGTPYGSGNQVTYLLEPMRRANPALYHHDWLVATTTQYHPVFSWLVAPLYGGDPSAPGGPLAFAIGQLVIMVATFVLFYRLIAAIAAGSAVARLAMFAALIGLLAVGGGRALAGSYLFAGYLQPSSLATLGWLAAMLAWLRNQPVRTGLWLALGGVFHVNFVVLGLALFGALELASQRPRSLADLRRFAAVLGPSLIVLIGFVPALRASAPAHDPELALRILSKFHAPGHYDPGRVLRWLPPLVAWLAIAWGAVPIARAAGGDAIARLWRFAVVATALCVAATALALLWLGATRLYVWRIAPFGQLASQLIILVAALTPRGADAPRSRGRAVALVAGAVVLIFESAYLGGGHYVYTAVLGAIAAIWLCARALRRPAIACVVAAAILAIPVVEHRDQLAEPPLFAGECAANDCELLRWVRGQTPVDAVFLVPPYDGWFRLHAQRAVVVDTKSPPLYPDELVAWYRRLCAIVDATDLPTHEAVEARWDQLTADQLVAATRKLDADYVMLNKSRSPTRLGLPVAFESADNIVYRVR